jgi:hypothetical protein
MTEAHQYSVLRQPTVRYVTYTSKEIFNIEKVATNEFEESTYLFKIEERISYVNKFENFQSLNRDFILFDLRQFLIAKNVYFRVLPLPTPEILVQLSSYSSRTYVRSYIVIANKNQIFPKKFIIVLSFWLLEASYKIFARNRY